MSKRGKSTTSTTVKRSASNRGRAPQRARAKKPLTQRMLAAQPLPPAVIRRIAVAMFALLLIGGTIGAAWATGVLAFAREEAIAAVGRAGFVVKRIEVNGVNRADYLEIYEKALEQKDRSMAAFSLAEVRNELLDYGWIGDARVSRRLPDTLVIDLVEREPVAVWQERGRYTLVDAVGRRLPGVDPASVPGLPVLVGIDPAVQMPAFIDLLDSAPSLRSQIAGAQWIGDRRWTLRFRTGEDLLLPENAVAAHAAFVEFAKVDGVNRLLGRGLVRMDMRFDDQLIMRPGREGAIDGIDLDTVVAPPRSRPTPAGSSPATPDQGG